MANIFQFKCCAAFLLPLTYGRKNVHVLLSYSVLICQDYVCKWGDNWYIHRGLTYKSTLRRESVIRRDWSFASPDWRVNNNPHNLLQSQITDALGSSFICHLQSSTLVLVAFTEMDNIFLHPIYLPSPHFYHGPSHGPPHPTPPSSPAWCKSHQWKAEKSGLFWGRLGECPDNWI